MARAKCPRCGATDTIAELDLIPGLAGIGGFDEDAEPEFAGYTEVLWNDQIAQRDEHGNIIYVCTSCDQQLRFAELVLLDDQVVEKA